MFSTVFLSHRIPLDFGRIYYSFTPVVLFSLETILHSKLFPSNTLLFCPILSSEQKYQIVEGQQWGPYQVIG